MVGSYLICDECGQFGPPASFLSKNGLRLCYQCWYRERLNDESPTENASEPAPPSSPEPEPSGRSDGE